MKMLIMCMFLVPVSMIVDKILISELFLIMLYFMINYSFFSWDMPCLLTFSLFFDKLSFYLVVLSYWVSLLMFLTLENNNFYNKACLLIITLAMTLALLFMSLSSIMFFCLFEFSIFPTILLILGWGYQPERIDALFNFILFTITPSTPFLVWLLSSISLEVPWIIMINDNTMLWSFDQSGKIMFFAMFTMFFVKMPLYFTHYWLPKAHVEAPVSGSMILAAILLKMGGYGVIRFMPMLILNSSMYDNFFFIVSVSIVGMVISCLTCIFSPDLKMIVAYSSVSHMNFMISGVMMNSLTSMMGGLLMMLSHALCSSGMFYLSDILYKRSGSRSLFLNKAMNSTSPLMILCWLMFCMFNMAFPLSVSNLSELFLGLTLVKMTSLMSKSFLFLYFLLSAYYSMFMYCMINSGVSSLQWWPMNMKEILIIILHFIPLMSMLLISYQFK